MLRPDDYPALLLNADGRPMSFAPLSTLSWQKAVEAVVANKCMVLAEYGEDVVARSPSLTIRLPSVIASYVYRDMHRPAAFTRLNVFLAYGFRCAYCGGHFRTPDLTYDHVLPRARGGATGWSNCAPACRVCNQRKACRTPAEARMPLLFKLRRPVVAEINAAAMTHADRVKALHRSWADYLYWDSDVGEPA